MRKANIFFSDKLAGVLVEDDGYYFEYDPNYKGQPISLTMPLEDKNFHSNVLFPFFDGLIPEGKLLELGSKAYNISPLDRMGLLLALCHDSIGAVSVIEIK